MIHKGINIIFKKMKKIFLFFFLISISLNSQSKFPSNYFSNPLDSDLILQTPIKPDSLPTVIIDSLTLNRPVVSTDIGGCSEILNKGGNGLLIPLNDSKYSAKLIYEYSNNLNLQREHLKNASVFLKQNFSRIEFEKRILNELSRVYNG